MGIRTVPWFAGALGALVFATAHSQQAESSHEHHVAPATVAVPSDDDSSQARHVPPDPPAHEMGDMPYRAMAEMMQMDDTERFGRIILDQAESRDAEEGTAAVWDGQAYYGSDYNKIWLKSEGERSNGRTEEAKVELFWDHIFSRWWSVQAGARRDFGTGPGRTWAAIGVEGLAPYWFDVEATVYLGEQGRTAARLKTEYELLLTQRLILQPEMEANLYGKADRERQVGSGLSNLEVGIRLRYEIRREFAPYVGLAWQRFFGETADLSRASGRGRSDLQAVAGLRIWF
jgi:copper resistance protein B